MISTRWRYVTMQSAPVQTRNGHRNALPGLGILNPCSRGLIESELMEMAVGVPLVPNRC
jgi:hypothetical protein